MFNVIFNFYKHGIFFIYMFRILAGQWRIGLQNLPISASFAIFATYIYIQLAERINGILICQRMGQKE